MNSHQESLSEIQKVLTCKGLKFLYFINGFQREENFKLIS